MVSDARQILAGETYNPPREKTTVKAIFCRRVICSPQTIGIGRHRMKTSSTKAIDPMAWKNCTCPFMQCPFNDLS